MKLTARSRLETYASLSRTQSDEETYGLRMEPSVLASGDSDGAGGDGAGGCDCDGGTGSKVPGMRYVTYLIYIILWEGMIFGGTGYVVFWMGYSGWWFALAIFVGAMAYSPLKWIHGINE